jgi:ATP-dependent exoDNAse (exonuclease V) alpha subunit
MATWHIDIVRREKSGGQVQEQSVVAAAAYLCGEHFLDYDYSTKSGEVIYTEILAPHGAPEWVYDWKTLWQSLEKGEVQKNAQLARSIYFSLPPELTHECHISLVREYAHTFVEEGMITMVAIHDAGTGNPNAHLLLTMRPLSSDGQWVPKSRKVYMLDEHGQKIRLPSGEYKSYKQRTTTWDDPGNVEKWRRLWADITNAHLKLAGLEHLQIDHRSYERQGIQKIPGIRLSCDEYNLEQQGIHTEGGEMNRIIHTTNEMLDEIEELRKKMLHTHRGRGLSAHQKELKKAWKELHERERQIKELSEVVLAEVWKMLKEEVAIMFSGLRRGGETKKRKEKGRLSP